MIDRSRSIFNREPIADKRFFTSREIARILGVSESTLRNLAKSGHITPNRIGAGSIRYSRDSLNHFIEANQRGNGPPLGTDYVACPFLKIPDAARYLSVSVRKLHDLTKSRLIASIRIGRGRKNPRVLYSAASLEHYANGTDTREGAK